MSINARSILIAVANLFALFVVIGVCSQGTLLNAKNAASETAAVNLAQEEPSVEQAADLPMITERQTRAKGKGKSAVEEIDCIPLYPTPAPTKGKGMNGRGGRRARGNGNGKGKGSTDAPTVSASPSFFCSDAPSVSPTVSAAPSVSAAPTPSETPAPTKGKGMNGRGGGGSSKGKGRNGRRD